MKRFFLIKSKLLLLLLGVNALVTSITIACPTKPPKDSSKIKKLL